nr:hypothetical protein BaRGS_011948 [Batillaria attramentaria]
MKGHDAHLPDSSQCFVFKQGYPGLPYDAITLSGSPSSYVDFHFSGELNFQDLALSLYVYPEGPKPHGTLLSYKCATGNVIRLSVMQDLFFVNFWDEYGVSVGMTAIPSLLNGDAWNHLVLIRQFATGTIQVYHDGELVEDLDDDFPNKIQLPIAGAMRLARGHEESQQGLGGRYACFQMFSRILTRDDVRNIAANCRPETWNIQPEVHLETRVVDDEEKQCVTDYTPRALADPVDFQVKAVSCDLLGLHCLTGSVAWNAVMRKHNWIDSGRQVAYYYMVARGHLPSGSDAEGSLLGKVSASDRRVCSRLCMRAPKYGAQSWLHEDALPG